jgi:hypothetical protein
VDGFLIGNVRANYQQAIRRQFRLNIKYRNACAVAM